MGIGVEYELWLFDRCGEQIFYSNNIHKGWDESVKGKITEPKQDVYVWKVNVKDVFKKWYSYIWRVTLFN